MICSSQRTGGAFQPRPYERRSDLSAAWGLATSTTLFFNGLFFCPFCHPTKLFLFSTQDSGCFATFVCGVQRRSAPWPPREQEQNLPEKQALHSDFTHVPWGAELLQYYLPIHGRPFSDTSACTAGSAGFSFLYASTISFRFLFRIFAC